jgi:hypothetical protein
MAEQEPAGWRSDPVGAHEQRWWDGERWTDWVCDAGVATTSDDAPPEPVRRTGGPRNSALRLVVVGAGVVALIVALGVLAPAPAPRGRRVALTEARRSRTSEREASPNASGANSPASLPSTTSTSTSAPVGDPAAAARTPDDGGEGAATDGARDEPSTADEPAAPEGGEEDPADCSPHPDNGPDPREVCRE